MAKEAKRAHFVGTFKRGGILDRRTYYAYCVYPSKLARIALVQGKAQLGQDYGPADGPNCSGFTLAELAQLDFEAMDLSEFYEDVVDRAAVGVTPAQAQAVTDIQQKMEARWPETQESP